MIKNVVLKAVIFIALLVFCGCACCMDSDNIKPFVVGMVVSGAILALFYYANVVRGDRE